MHILPRRRIRGPVSVERYEQRRVLVNFAWAGRFRRSSLTFLNVSVDQHMIEDDGVHLGWSGLPE